MSDLPTKDPELGTQDLKAVPSSTSSSPSPVVTVREGETLHHLPSFEHEKRLCLKFDLRILPVLAAMYFFNALDKGNLGNAVSMRTFLRRLGFASRIVALILESKRVSGDADGAWVRR